MKRLIDETSVGGKKQQFPRNHGYASTSSTVILENRNSGSLSPPVGQLGVEEANGSMEMSSKGLETQHLRTGKNMAREVNIIVKVVLDVICILVVGIPLLILHLIGQPFKRGVNCDDESLRYPFYPSTITNVTLYCVGIFVPTFVITLTEFIRYYRKPKDVPTVRHIFYRWNIHPFLWQWYVKVGVFAFGACLSQMTTDIAKYSIGRLRPHFWDICDPDINCSISANRHAYITTFNCKSGKDDLIREARLSFLSGHSSFSAYTMVYLVFYMQSRVNFCGVKLLRPFVQALCLYAAWFTALSRISDYKHHWSDVLAGSIQGTVVALLVVFFISDLFPRKKKENSSLDQDNYPKPPPEFSSYHFSETNKVDSEQGS